jgi:hypothetical protein
MRRPSLMPLPSATTIPLSVCGLFTKRTTAAIWSPSLARLIEQQIAAAVAVKEERVFAHVVQWALAFICHDRQGEHNAMRALARECGGDIPPFREIPAHTRGK